MNVLPLFNRKNLLSRTLVSQVEKNNKSALNLILMFIIYHKIGVRTIGNILLINGYFYDVIVFGVEF